MNKLGSLTMTAMLLLAPLAPAWAAQWDASSAAFHSHVVAVGKGFELHVHDKAKHLPVDLTRGKVTASMLKDGKRIVVPLVHKQTGIMTSTTVLAGKWTILVALNLTGSKPEQIRFTSASNHKHDHDHDHEH